MRDALIDEFRAVYSGQSRLGEHMLILGGLVKWDLGLRMSFRQRLDWGRGVGAGLEVVPEGLRNTIVVLAESVPTSGG